jgi:transposase
VRKAGLRATVLLREIRALGYTGGITQLKAYLRSVRPAPPIEPIVRFETEPGQQLQIDFVDFRRGSSPLRAFTAELGYSRYAYVEFTDNERTETLVSCLERALAFFGGAPLEILCDNPKTIVIERNAYGEGEHRYNRHLLDLAKHYGVRIGSALPIARRPRGRWNGFIVTCGNRSSCLCRRRKRLPSTSRWRIAKRIWLDEITNVRVHATLKERPIDRLADERPFLRALPLPYGGRHITLEPLAAIAVPLPVESLQHPLPVYQTLVEELV